MKKLLVALMLLTAGCSMVAADEAPQTRETLEQEIRKLEKKLKDDAVERERLLKIFNTYCAKGVLPTYPKSQLELNREHQKRFCLARWFSHPIQQEYTKKGCEKLLSEIYALRDSQDPAQKELIALREELREIREKNN